MKLFIVRDERDPSQVKVDISLHKILNKYHVKHFAYFPYKPLDYCFDSYQEALNVFKGLVNKELDK